MRRMMACALCVAVFLLLTPVTLAQAAAPKATLDGEVLTFECEPVILQGVMMAPIRAVAGRMGASVSWSSSTRTAVITKGDKHMAVQMDSNTALINGQYYSMPATAKLINGFAMMPLRFLAEHLGAAVRWEAATATVHLLTRHTLVLGDNSVTIGNSLNSLLQSCGQPNRKDSTPYGYTWYVYNKDYTKFMMVGVQDGMVVAFYTNAKGFVADGMPYGGRLQQMAGGSLRIFLDNNDGYRIYACLASPNTYIDPEKTYSFADEAEKQIFDCTNTFRFNQGMSTLKVDSIAEKTARGHSQDMGKRNYFSHTTPEGVRFNQRYVGNGGKLNAAGENIAAGNLFGYITFDQWVRSKGHRDNMLNESHTHMGVGVAVNTKARYFFYSTQLFTREK